MKVEPFVRRSVSAFSGLCVRLSGARDGAVAIALALSFIPLVVSVGVGIDLGRAYLVKERLTHTTDAAGLAIGASIDSGADLQDVLDGFFSANFPDGGIGTVTASNYSVIDNVITVTATATVETTFMKVVGINDVTVSASSEITREDNTLEVVLVLDNSGSMGDDGKLGDLKDASESLVDILFGSDATSDQVKIGLVPFSNNVNIGPANTSYVNDTTAYDWGTEDWGGCTMAETTDDEDTKDDFVGPWDPFHWPDDGNNNWISGGNYQINNSRGPNLYCPEQEIVPLTNVKATLVDAIDDMEAFGGTHINWGAIWGWRVISPTEPFTEGVAYGTADHTKAVIILTDGANTAYSFVYDAFGYPEDELLGAGINTAGEVADEIDDRLATICTNMKAEGIIVYTITFDLNDADTQDIFEACATDTDKYYDSPSGTELSKTFRAIAAELKKLAVTG